MKEHKKHITYNERCNVHVELKFEEREERKIGTEAIIDKTIMAGIFQNQ